MKSFTVKPGDKVAYSVNFLRSIGESHGDISHDRGIVKSVKTYGKSLTLATINWEGDSPDKVAVANLAKVGLNTRFCQC